MRVVCNLSYIYIYIILLYKHMCVCVCVFERLVTIVDM